MTEVTHILKAIEQGDAKAAQQLLPLVYDELRRLAGEKMAREKPGQTLDATALVHEAYIRLVGNPPPAKHEAPNTKHQTPKWDSRGHFFAAAAEAMRRILVDKARRKKRQRHGGERHRVDLLDIAEAAAPDDEQILLLDDALTRLAAVRPQAAQIVQLRFFSGCTLEEAAPLLGVSERTARRLWIFARAWLRREMEALARQDG